MAEQGDKLKDRQSPLQNPSLQRLLARSGISLQAAWRHLWHALPRSPLLLIFLIAYVVLRLGVLISMGSSTLTALRSAVFGLGFYGLAILVIDAIHYHRGGAFSDQSIPGTAWERANWKALFALLAVWVCWALKIIDGLQRRGSMPGGPLLDFLPGWVSLESSFQSLSERLSNLFPLWTATTFYGVITNLLFFVLVPLVLLFIAGYRWRDLALSCKNWLLAAPFLMLFSLAFLFSQPDSSQIAFLAYAILYPGLTEEFFYRGLLQRALRGWLRPVNAILVASLFFAALHIPWYYYELYQAHLGLTLLNVMDVCLFGLFIGYGFFRSGGLLPWVVAHALNDVVGL
jgi:membrane protease YdiL (CAAX protease family)